MQQENRNMFSRLILVYFILLLIFVFPIIYNIIKIQWIDGEQWREKADENTIALHEVKAQRGTIYSSDGQILATSLPVFDVYIDLGVQKAKKTRKEMKQDPSTTYKLVPMIPDTVFLPQLRSLSKKLSELFPEKTPQQYHDYLLKAWHKKSRYVLIHKDVQITQLDKMKTFPILCRPETTIQKKQIDSAPKKAPGFRRAVILERRDIRINPYKNLARHTIGFLTKKDGSDTSYNGLDGYYDQYLRGQQGERWERRLNKDVWLPINDKDQKRAINGQNIVATIDTRLQDLAENSLRRCLMENEADYGCVVLMEVETGYVRAISNLSLVDSVYGYRETRNIACTDLYEPGSTYKAITAMVLLENQKCDTSYIVPTGRKQFSKHKDSEIHDVKDYSHGNISMKRSFEVSSNVGTCQPVWDFYRETRNEFAKSIKQVLPYKRLNLDIDVGGEPNPKMVDDLRPDRNFLNLAYGYSSNITALQLLTFYNAIANNGKMVKPIFCSEIKEREETIKKIQPEVIKERICSEQTLHILKDMLTGVVEKGSARRLSKTPYGIAGKTGTSQINYTEKGNQKMNYRASFVGFFPREIPKYSCIVVITNPKKNKTHGGELAAPVFKDLADKVCGTFLNIEMNVPSQEDIRMPYVQKGSQNEIRKVFKTLDIEYQSDDQTSPWVTSELDTNDHIIYKAYSVPEGIVPNCKGMTIKDAIYLLEKIGLQVSFDGKGKVVSQSLTPKTPYKKGNRIHLKLGIEKQYIPKMEKVEREKIAVIATIPENKKTKRK